MLTLSSIPSSDATGSSGPDVPTPVSTRSSRPSAARLAAASCPFCLTMLRDRLQDKDRADIQVKDIAQIVAGAMI